MLWWVVRLSVYSPHDSCASVGMREVLNVCETYSSLRSGLCSAEMAVALVFESAPADVAVGEDNSFALPSTVCIAVKGLLPEAQSQAGVAFTVVSLGLASQLHSIGLSILSSSALTTVLILAYFYRNL